MYICGVLNEQDFRTAQLERRSIGELKQSEWMGGFETGHLWEVTAG